MSDRIDIQTSLPEPPPTGRRGEGIVRLAVAAGAVLALASVGLTLGGSLDPTGETALPPSPAPGGTTTPSATPESLGVPRAADASPSALKVVLTWKPAAGRAPDTYAVYRDGKIIARLTSGPLRFVDTGVTPSTTYTYEIAGDDAQGPEGPPAVVRVTTEAGSPAEGRLIGTFDVTLETTSRYGYGDDPVDEWTAGIRFVPDCAAGPCDVEARDIHGDFPTITLTRDGAVYTGAGSGRIGVTCGGTEVTSSVRYQIRVTTAKTVGGVWRATKITGTLSWSEPTQLGCRAAGSTSSIQGHLVP